MTPYPQSANEKPKLILVSARKMRKETTAEPRVDASGSDWDKAARLDLEQVICDELLATCLAVTKLSRNRCFGRIASKRSIEAAKPAICA